MLFLWKINFVVFLLAYYLDNCAIEDKMVWEEIVSALHLTCKPIQEKEQLYSLQLLWWPLLKDGLESNYRFFWFQFASVDHSDHKAETGVLNEGHSFESIGIWYFWICRLEATLCSPMCPQERLLISDDKCKAHWKNHHPSMTLLVVSNTTYRNYRSSRI